MKEVSLKRKTLFSSIICFLLVCGASFLIYMILVQEKRSEKIIKRIKNETVSIRSNIEDLQMKKKDTEKYKKIWNSLTPNKKITKGIKLDDINSTLKKVSDKYGILDPQIKVELPKKLTTSKFKRKTVDIIYTSANIKFSAASDVKALLFVSDLMKSLHGYPIITNLNIRKNREYTRDDLLQISSGQKSGLIIGRMSFVWYAYREDRKRTKVIKKIDEAK